MAEANPASRSSSIVDFLNHGTLPERNPKSGFDVKCHQAFYLHLGYIKQSADSFLLTDSRESVVSTLLGDVNILQRILLLVGHEGTLTEKKYKKLEKRVSRMKDAINRLLHARSPTGETEELKAILDLVKDLYTVVNSSNNGKVKKTGPITLGDIELTEALLQKRRPGPEPENDYEVPGAQEPEDDYEVPAGVPPLRVGSPCSLPDEFAPPAPPAGRPGPEPENDYEVPGAQGPRPEPENDYAVYGAQEPEDDYEVPAGAGPTRSPPRTTNDYEEPDYEEIPPLRVGSPCSLPDEFAPPAPPAGPPPAMPPRMFTPPPSSGRRSLDVGIQDFWQIAAEFERMPRPSDDHRGRRSQFPPPLPARNRPQSQASLLDRPQSQASLLDHHASPAAPRRRSPAKRDSDEDPDYDDIAD